MATDQSPRLVGCGLPVNRPQRPRHASKERKLEAKRQRARTKRLRGRVDEA
jgi:ribosome-associated protein